VLFRSGRYDNDVQRLRNATIPLPCNVSAKGQWRALQCDERQGSNAFITKMDDWLDFGGRVCIEFIACPNVFVPQLN